MSASERQQEIILLIFSRRHVTYANLENEFNVSRKTIARDIKALSCSYPIETVRGRHGGGVKIADWFSRQIQNYHWSN